MRGCASVLRVREAVYPSTLGAQQPAIQKTMEKGRKILVIRVLRCGSVSLLSMRASLLATTSAL